MPPFPIGLTDAKQILMPHMPRLLTSMTDAFDLWWSESGYGRFHDAHDKSGRAKIISDQFYYHAKNALAGEPSVDFQEHGLQKYMLFDDRLIVRFKHLKRDFTTANYPTAQAKAWLSQGTLPGLPTHARVTFGYRLDELGIRINDAFVVLPNGDSQSVNDWVWQVLGDRIAEDDVTIHVLPLAPDSPPYQEVVYAYDDLSAAFGR